MKQKILISISMSMDDEKSRSKALKTVFNISGVESAAWKGDAKNQVEIIGEGIDAVKLTRKLRKNVACTELVSVGEHKTDNPGSNNNTSGSSSSNNNNVITVVDPYDPRFFWYHNGYPVYPEAQYACPYNYRNYNHDPSCIIM